MFHNKVFSLNEDQSLLDGMSRKHVFKMTVDPSCDSFSSPMWGSMFFPGDPNVSEEDYYIAREFNEEEIKEGLALSVQKFCQNSYQERAPSMRPVESSEAKV